MSEFAPIVSDVEFNVNLGQTRADLGEVRRIYAETTGAMSDDALRMAVAQEKLNRSLARAGPESLAAKRATIQYRGELAALAAQADRTAAEQVAASQRAAAAQLRTAAEQVAASQRAAAAQLRSAQTVGHALTRYIAAPTALIAFEAVKMRVQFERQMLMVQTQAGASAAEVAKLHDKVLALATVSPQGPDALAKGLYHLESLGLRGAAAMGVLKTSSTAAFMGVADLEEVTTALGGAVVTGIKGTENFDRAMGTLNATIGAGNMQMGDLVAALGTGILPAAKNAGLSLDQVGAALAVLTDRGMGADESATRLRMTFALMEAPSKKAQKALKDMGIDGHDLNAMLRQPDGLLKVLDLLHARMDAVGKVRGSRDVIEAFGGGRSSAAILTLIQSLDSAISSYQGKLADVRKNTDKFFADQHDVKNSDAYKLATAWSKIQVDLIKLGSTVTPIVVTVVGGLTKVADGFDHLGKVGKTEVEVLVGLLAVGGPLLLVTAGVIRAVRTIGDAFATIPAKAAPAIAATDAEIATIGTTAVAAEAEVAGLRGGMVGLAATAGPLAGIVLGIGAIATAAEIAAPYVNSLMDKLGIAGGGTVSTRAQFDALPGYLKKELIAKGVTANSFPSGPNTSGMSNDLMHDAGGRQPASPAGATPSTAAVEVYHPSRAAQLNLALAKNPNDVAAINAKLAYDREAAAFAQKRIAAGRGTPKLEQELQGVYGDINSLEGQLAAMSTAATSKHDEAVRKAAEAAKKKAELARKAREKLAKERQATITRLTGIPIDLQIAEITAENQHASDERLKKIYERQLVAVEAQLRTLRRMHASKQDIYNALSTQNGIEQKIAGLSKQSTSTSAADLKRELEGAVAGLQQYAPNLHDGTTVHVSQHFPSPPTTDGNREAIYARHAMLAAFDG